MSEHRDIRTPPFRDLREARRDKVRTDRKSARQMRVMDGRAGGFVQGCSCHVWAIDGYSVNAGIVNERYNEKTTGMLVDGDCFENLVYKVGSIVDHCRRKLSLTTAETIRIYGGFADKNLGGPEHMWIEYKGYIYDTMPGHPLRRAPATQDRLHPPCELAPFPADLVGSVVKFLTEDQRRLIKSKEWNNDELWL